MRPHTNEECYQSLLDDYIDLERKHEDLKEEYKDLKEKNKSNSCFYCNSTFSRKTFAKIQ